jgi:hypothetical protein
LYWLSFLNESMMKTFLFCLSWAVAGSAAKAQMASDRSPLNVKTSGYNVMINVVDKDGKPFAPEFDVQGHPFFEEQWSLANVALSNGKTYGRIKARVNIHQGTLHFMNPAGTEMYLTANELSRIELLDSLTNTVKHIFIKIAVPNKTGGNDHALYQVLAEGKISLLKQLQKNIGSYTHEFSKEITRSFEQKDSYWVFAHNQLQPLKRKASFWEALMEDKWKAVEARAASNDWGFKETADLIKLIQYYNGL